MDTHERRLESGGVDLLSYTAPGETHVVLNDERFYSENINGVTLVDWLSRLVAGEPVEDVRCSYCR